MRLGASAARPPVIGATKRASRSPDRASLPPSKASRSRRLMPACSAGVSRCPFGSDWHYLTNSISRRGGLRGLTDPNRPDARCRLGVNRVILTTCRRLPVFPGKRTFSGSVRMSQRCGGLNRSKQHFILKGKDGVWRWIRDFVEGLQRPRRRSYGIAGSAGSRSRRSGGRLASRHRRFIFRCHRTVGFVQLLDVVRGWR